MYQQFASGKSLIFLFLLFVTGCILNLSAQNCSTPTNPAVTGITPVSATLNWDAMPGANAYEVNYRPMNAPSTAPWNTVNVAANSVTVNALASSTLYTAQIRSVCGSNFSDFTSNVTFSTQSCVPPSGITVGNINLNSANVQWTPANGAVGYQLLYRVAVTNAGAWNSVSVPGNSHTLTGLTANTLYGVRLISDCGGTTSDTSQTVFFSTGGCEVPQNLMITAQTASSISLSWNPVQNVTVYNLQYRAMGVNTWTSVNSNTNSRTVNGLTGNTLYEFRVRTNCGGGNTSAYTLPINGFTLPCTMPENAMVSNVTVNSAQISWNNAVGANQYRIDYRVVGQTWTTVNASAATRNLTGLTPNTDYEVRLRSRCGGNQLSAYTDTLVFKTKSCITPQSFNITQTSFRYVDLIWNNVSNAQNYNIQYQITGDTAWISVNENDTTRRINNLNPNTQYNFRIRSKCANNIYSDFSAIQVTTTLHCAPPNEVLAGHVNATAEIISWSTVQGAIGYQLDYKEVNANTWTTLSVNNNSRQINNLNSNTTYSVRVRSRCGNGVFSDYTAPIYFTKSACATPVNPVINYNNNQTFNVQFTPVPNTLQYGFDYRPAGNHVWINQVSASPNLTVKHWNLCSNYEYRTTRICSLGIISDYSSVQQYTTPSDEFCNDRPPIGVADFRILPVNQMAVVNVLANDSDPDGDSLFLDPLNPPVLLQGTGQMDVLGNNIRFIPGRNFTGYVTIEYTPYANNRKGNKTFSTLKYQGEMLFAPTGCECNLVPNGDFEDGAIPNSQVAIGTGITVPLDNQFMSCWSNYSGLPKVLDRRTFDSPSNPLYATLGIPFTDFCSNLEVNTHDNLNNNNRVMALKAGGVYSSDELRTRDGILTRLKRPLQPGEKYNISFYVASFYENCNAPIPIPAIEIYLVNSLPNYLSGFEDIPLFQTLQNEGRLTRWLVASPTNYFQNIPGWQFYQNTGSTFEPLPQEETPYLLIRAVPQPQANGTEPGPFQTANWILLDDLCIEPVLSCPQNNIQLTKVVKNQTSEQITFTVSVKNNGNQNAERITLSDFISGNGNMTYAGINGIGVTASGNAQQLNVIFANTLTPGNTFSVDISYTKNGTICGTNTVQLESYNLLPARCLQETGLSVSVPLQESIALTTTLGNNICQNAVTVFTLTAQAGFESYRFSGPSWANIPATITPNNTVEVTVSGNIPAGNAEFKVEAFNGACQFSGTATVNILQSPIITANPITGCINNPLTVTADISNAGENAQYRWVTPAGEIVTTPVITISSATNVHAGTYTLTVTTEQGCTATAQVTVSLNGLQVAITPNPAQVCNGQSVQLTATGIENGVYLWTGGPFTQGETNNVINANPITTANYTLTVTLGGCTATAETVVTVNANPKIVTADKTICGSGATTLNVSGADSYSWSPADGLSATNIANPTASPTQTRTYTVTGTDANGCSATAQATVTVKPDATPPAITTEDKAICKGQSAILSASGTDSYSWNPADGLSATNIFNPTATPTQTTTYTVTGTDVNGCTATAQVKVTVYQVTTQDRVICGSPGSISLTASGATSYSWEPAAGLSATNIADPIATLTETKTYTVTGTHPEGCTTTAVATVTINANAIPPTIAISAQNQTICLGGSTKLTASGGTSYSWRPAAGLSAANIADPTANPTQTTTYTVIGSDANACAATAQVTVTVKPLQPIILTPTVCNGIIKLNPGTTALPLTVDWRMISPNNTPFFSLNANQTEIQLIFNGTPPLTQEVSATVTDANGCRGTVRQTIIIREPPLVLLTISDNQTICAGQSATLSATGAPGLIWYEGTSATPLVGNPITVSPPQTTTYRVELEGCVMGSVTVTVNQNTTINWTEQTAVCDRFNRRRVCINTPGESTYFWNSVSSGVAVLPDVPNGHCATVFTLDPTANIQVSVSNIPNDPCPQIITLNPVFTGTTNRTAVNTTDLAGQMGITPINGVYTIDGNVNNLKTLTINTFTVDAPLVLRNVNVVAVNALSAIDLEHPLTLDNCYLHAPLSFFQINQGTISNFIWRGIREIFNIDSPEQRVTLINSKLEHANVGISSQADETQLSRLTVASINSCFNQNANHISITIDGTSIPNTDPINTLNANSPFVIRGSRFDCDLRLQGIGFFTQTGISVLCRQLPPTQVQNIDIGHPDVGGIWDGFRNTFTRMAAGISITNPSMTMGRIRINNNDFVSLVNQTFIRGAGILVLRTNQIESPNQFYNLQVGGLAGTGNRTDNTFFNMARGIDIPHPEGITDRSISRGIMTIAENTFGNLGDDGIYIGPSPDGDLTLRNLIIENNNIGTIGNTNRPVRKGIHISQSKQMDINTNPPLIIVRNNQIAYTQEGVQFSSLSTIVPRLQVLNNRDIIYVQTAGSSGDINHGVLYVVTSLASNTNQPIAQIIGNVVRSNQPTNYSITNGVFVKCDAVTDLITFDIEDNFIDNVGDPLLGSVLYNGGAENLPMIKGIEFLCTGTIPNQSFNIRNNLIRGSELPNNFSTGIQVNNTNSVLLECNRIANTTVGIRADQDCDFSTLYTNVVRNPSYAGLALTSNGIIGVQGFPNGDSYGNAWSYGPSTLYGTASIASIGNDSRITDNGVNFAPGYTDNPHSVASIGFPTDRMLQNTQTGTPRSANCNNNDQNLAWPQVINLESSADYWLKWLRPEPQYAIFDEEAKYMHGLKLLRKLENDIAFRNSDSRLDSFYLTKAQKNEKRLLMIENDIREGKFQLALALNQGLNPVNVIEETYQKVNAVFLQSNLRSKQPSSSLSSNEYFTPEEWQTILQTSVLCPEKYGAGVYQARILRAIKEEGSRYYESNCLPILTRNEAQSKAVTPFKGNFSLYPNPATESLTLKYATDRDFRVTLSDIMGRKITEIDLAQFGEHTFDVSELPAGIYGIRAFNMEGTTLFTDKIVITK